MNIDEGQEEVAETTSETTPTTSLSLMEVSALEKYLLKVCGALLDLDDKEEANFEKAIKDPATTTTLNKFISHSKSPVLVIQKGAKGTFNLFI